MLDGLVVLAQVCFIVMGANTWTKKAEIFN